MTTDTGRSRRRWLPTDGVMANFDTPDMDAGYAKSIAMLTSHGDTFLDVMSRTILNADETDLIAEAYRRAVEIAKDSDSPYDEEDLISKKLSQIKKPLPKPAVWVLSICVARLSVGGENFNRIATMHVHPATMPGPFQLGWNKIENALNSLRGIDGQ